MSEIPMVFIGRETCDDLLVAGNREWLVTNGIGGYAMGALDSALDRGYHGLLIAALQPPVGRMLLAAKLDETAAYMGQDYPLFVNRWASGLVEPDGWRYVQSFELEGMVPVWTYAIADALIEKRVWMRQHSNTTYVQYRLRRASAALTLRLKALVTARDHHAFTRPAELAMTVEATPQGLRILPGGGAPPIYLLCRGANARAGGQWFDDYYWNTEAYRGLHPIEHLYLAGEFEARLAPGDTLTFVASTEPDPLLDGEQALAERRLHEQQLLDLAAPHLGAGMSPAIRQLVLAADQFVVKRPQAGGGEGRSIIAGYPWFGDWGRDTMISLPGLTLVTGRPDVARDILLTFAHYVDRGMLPNRFPDAGETPEYNTIDATLWYFEAIRAYVDATDDETMLGEIYPVLSDIIDWHRRGTRYRIKVDPEDGLLSGGEAGVQLTWMDAKVDDWVVTPRMGKPVEVNALWYNALRVMAGFARRLGHDEAGAQYDAWAEQTRAGFRRFWNPAAGCLFDVLDGPAGDDPALRPNQILAVSLPYSPLPAAQQRVVVDICAHHLLTSHGLRSLAPSQPGYIGHYGGPRRARDAAYHQGTVWSWLIGPFVSAHLRVYKDPATAASFLTPLMYQVRTHGLGTVSEILRRRPAPPAPRLHRPGLERGRGATGVARDADVQRFVVGASAPFLPPKSAEALTTNAGRTFVVGASAPFASPQRAEALATNQQYVMPNGSSGRACWQQ